MVARLWAAFHQGLIPSKDICQRHVRAQRDERDADPWRVFVLEGIQPRAALPGRQNPPDLGRNQSDPAHDYRAPSQAGDRLMTTALSGIRVAAFTHFAAGPIAAQYLGALGADVIKVEATRQDVNRYAVRHPDGLLQGISPYFLATNRNQRCLGLDLKSRKGLEVARRLIVDSDVVIENYRPG